MSGDLLSDVLLWGAFAFFVISTLGAAVVIVHTQRKLLEGERRISDRLGEVDAQRQELLASMNLLNQETKSQERERLRVLAQLEERNKQLERFAYVVSHDFKNPLITIKSYLALIREDAEQGDTESFLRHVERIAASADEMNRLFEQLIDFHRVGWLQNTPQAVHCEVVVQDALDRVLGTSPGNIRVELATSLPTFVVDRARLEELFQILLENCVKFFGDQPEPRIEIGALMQDEEIVCYVADNGIGIEERYHEKIFELFERLDPRIEGTGTGLAMARRIVEQHYGRLWVESEGQGCGSRFCFTLPEADAQLLRARGVRGGGSPISLTEEISSSEDVTQTSEELAELHSMLKRRNKTGTGPK